MSVSLTPADTSRPADVPAPRTLFLNAFVAALLGSAIQVMLHEMVHWVTGASLGYRSTMYPFGVTHEPEPVGIGRATTAMSAVVFSLVLGILCIFWQPFRRRRGFLHLLWLWFAFSSAMEGIGYLEIALFGAGDTASFMAALAMPTWVGFVFLAIGIAGQFWLAAQWAPHIRRYCADDNRAAGAFSAFPWLATIPVNLALSLLWFTMSGMSLTTGEMVAILMAGVALTVWAPMGFMFLKRQTVAFEEPRLSPVPVGGIIAFAVWFVVCLLLTRGLSIGG